MNLSQAVSAADWGKGIGLSVLASLIGCASKLSIRKSWLIEETFPHIRTIPIDESQSSSHDTGIRIDSDTVVGSSHNDDDRVLRRRKLLANGLRISGMIGMSVLNPICCVLAMNYASPSILAPFSGLTLVWVIVFSYPALAELPSTSQIVAASLIVTGEVIVAVFGDHTNDDDDTIEHVVGSTPTNSWVLD
jgi:hypothetical protein